MRLLDPPRLRRETQWAHQRLPSHLVRRTPLVVHEVLVDRLVALYGWPTKGATPGGGILFNFPTLGELLRSPPRGSGAYDRRGSRAPALAGWHTGRIRFFYDEIKAGRALDPVSISDAGVVPLKSFNSAKAVFLDGHHRLAASVLAGAKTLKATFAGRDELRDYLTGQLASPP